MVGLKPHVVCALAVQCDVEVATFGGGFVHTVNETAISDLCGTGLWAIRGITAGYPESKIYQSIDCQPQRFWLPFPV